MSPRRTHPPILSSVSILLIACASVAACAPPARPPAATTSAAAATSPAPAARQPARATEAAPAPDGELACKTRDAFGVVTEVYLQGERATLRRVTPSGMNEEQPLRVERHGDALIGDHPASEDLAVHAMTLRHAEGRKYLRLGDWQQSWSACM